MTQYVFFLPSFKSRDGILEENEGTGAKSSDLPLCGNIRVALTNNSHAGSAAKVRRIVDRYLHESSRHNLAEGTTNEVKANKSGAATSAFLAGGPTSGIPKDDLAAQDDVNEQRADHGREPICGDRVRDAANHLFSPSFTTLSRGFFRVARSTASVRRSLLRRSASLANGVASLMRPVKS